MAATAAAPVAVSAPVFPLEHILRRGIIAYEGRPEPGALCFDGTAKPCMRCLAIAVGERAGGGASTHFRLQLGTHTRDDDGAPRVCLLSDGGSDDDDDARGPPVPLCMRATRVCIACVRACALRHVYYMPAQQWLASGDAIHALCTDQARAIHRLVCEYA